MKPLFLVLITVCILIAGGVIFALSGIYNISARVPHLSLTFRALEIFRDRSIARHSRDVALPSFDDPSLALSGVIHFDETCRKCHGAPGLAREEFAQGLCPAPPALETAAAELNRREIFWIIDNGLKMTGMPAFGVNHESDEITAMTAFIEKLPKLDAAVYQRFVDEAEAATTGGHHHDQEETSQADNHGHADEDENHDY